MIETSIKKSWRGIFELNEEKNEYEKKLVSKND